MIRSSMRILLAATAALSSAPVLADGLVYNATGVTLDKDGRVERFSALQVTRDGRVAKLLKTRDNGGLTAAIANTHFTVVAMWHA